MHRCVQNQKGVAIGYIFGLVALLAVLGAVLAQTTGVKYSAIEQKRMADTLVSQATLIRSALFLCQISYPSGGASGGTDNRFPASTADIRNADCPGSSGLKVFGEVSDVLYPKRMRGFSDWSLTNDGTGVSITTTMNSATDINAKEAMTIAIDELGQWQTDSTATSVTYYLKK